MRYVLSLLLVITLIGCSNSEINQANHDTEDIEKDKPTENQEDVNEEGDDSARFHNVNFLLGIEEVTITGQAKATNNEVFYVVEQGEETIIEETKIPLEHQDEDWTKFEFEFELSKEMESSEDTLVVVLYGKDNQEKKINSNYLPIDFNMQFNTES